MTKRVRIENADMANYKVKVEVWDKGFPEGEPDKLAFEKVLLNPCDITGDDIYLTSTRYLIIKELPSA